MRVLPRPRLTHPVSSAGLIKTPQEYLQLPSEAGNELPIAQPRGPPPDPAACVSASANAGATGSVVVLGMLLAVAGVAAAGFSYYKKNKAAPRNTMVANPAYSNATGGGLGCASVPHTDSSTCKEVSKQEVWGVGLARYAATLWVWGGGNMTASRSV